MTLQRLSLHHAAQGNGMRATTCPRALAQRHYAAQQDATVPGAPQ